MENDNVHDDAPEAAARSEESSDDGRLDSWKEIGAYLKRDVTTVRRWEKREGLPVHRHLHDRRDSVYAYRSELDRWWQERRNHVTDQVIADTPASGRAPLSWSLVALLAIAAVAIAGAAAYLYGRTEPPDESELRFSIPPPPDASFGTISLSRDGRRLAFTAATRDGRSRLFVRPLGSLAAQALPGTDDAAFPFWSPDGQSIGF